MVNRLLYKQSKENAQTQHSFFSYRLLKTRVAIDFNGLVSGSSALCKCRLLALHKPFNRGGSSPRLKGGGNSERGRQIENEK